MKWLKAVTMKSGKMAAALKVFRDTAIEVEEANAQAIIDNAAVGLILANPDGIIHALNPRAEELFAADPEVLVGTSAFAIVEPGDQQRLEYACSEILHGAEDEYHVDTYNSRKVNETCFPTDIFITKVQQRSSIRLMITVHDVTEREQAHDLLRARVSEKTDHLRKINEKLRAEVKERKRVQNELVQAGKLAALGQLSAGIAHELNQPLSAIRYYLHNAEKLLELDEVALHKKNLEKMEELVERMASMIKHLKTFARRQQERLGPINVVPVIERALELLSGKIEENNIRVIRENKATLIEAYGEETGLEQVLLNIIGNAIDVLLDNSDDNRELSIKVGERNDEITIDIVDNGPGLAVQAPEVVFDPFYTTKEVGQGLGLGLSISYNLVKSFGGTISAVNRQTGGAVFTVTLQKSTMDN
jgi:two-component system phosphoglycerate transport system sensor histidine kinase PgtB